MLSYNAKSMAESWRTVRKNTLQIAEALLLVGVGGGHPALGLRLPGFTGGGFRQRRPGLVSVFGELPLQPRDDFAVLTPHAVQQFVVVCGQAFPPVAVAQQQAQGQIGRTRGRSPARAA